MSPPAVPITCFAVRLSTRGGRRTRAADVGETGHVQQGAQVVLAARSVQGRPDDVGTALQQRRRGGRPARPVVVEPSRVSASTTRRPERRETSRSCEMPPESTTTEVVAAMSVPPGAGVAGLSVEAVDLRDTVRSALDNVGHLAGDAQIDLIVDMPTEEVIAEVDPRRVERILRNLIANAIDKRRAQAVRIRMAVDEDTVAAPLGPFATCWSQDQIEGSDFTSQ